MRLLALPAAVMLAAATTSGQPAEPATTPPLLLAFCSYREQVSFPTIYFYEHDGVGAGRIVGSVEVKSMRSDYRPSLSRDGRWCLFGNLHRGGRPGTGAVAQRRWPAHRLRLRPARRPGRQGHLPL